MDKIELRKQMIKKRLDLSSEDHAAKSNLIISKLKQHPDFINAKILGIYVSFKNEVDTIALIQEIIKTKKVSVPKTNHHEMDFYLIDSLEELKLGTYGILEPHNNRLIDKNKIDLLIVPIVAYDRNNNRLGYGGGFYDRYLKDYHGSIIGLAFAFQQVKNLPVESYDLPIKTIIDEK